MQANRWLALLAVALLAAVGCGSSGTGAADKKGGTEAKKSEHHEEHGPGPHKGTVLDEEHGPGPHKGTVLDWGKYHLEICIDHGKKEARVYVLGADEKSPAPIKCDLLLLEVIAPQFSVELKPEPQAGDPKGKASCFVGTHAQLAIEKEYEGKVSGKVDGKSIEGDFKEEDEAHAHEAKKK
jgi:hypothetical protein